MTNCMEFLTVERRLVIVKQLVDPTRLIINARGPLAHISALDAMWVSFYSIGLLLASSLVVMATRKWVKNGMLSLLIHVIAFGMFIVGTVLMVLVVLTWPS